MLAQAMMARRSGRRPYSMAHCTWPWKVPPPAVLRPPAEPPKAPLPLKVPAQAFAGSDFAREGAARDAAPWGLSGELRTRRRLGQGYVVNPTAAMLLRRPTYARAQSASPLAGRLPCAPGSRLLLGCARLVGASNPVRTSSACVRCNHKGAGVIASSSIAHLDLFLHDLHLLAVPARR